METNTVAIRNSDISNAAFLKLAGRALIALFTSAAILITAFVAFNPHTSPSNANNITISGNEFKVVFGGAKKSATALQLAELSEDGRAILARPIQLNAEDYTFLDYTIAHRNAVQAIYLLWRTRENPAETAHATLYWNGNGNTTIDLSKNSAWKGHITELVLDIYGDLRGQPIEIQQLTLKPYSANALLSSIWTQWAAYRGWTQRSAHHLRGTQSKTDISPTAVVAIWSALALLLLAISFKLLRGADPQSRYLTYTAAILIPWISLDLLWQSELSTQLTETSALFSGKSQHEKQLADRESTLYKYANYLKENVLPEPGARIFLLHDSPHRTYTRLKAQYYLFPQNTYNYDRFPQKKWVQPGDYILVLGEIAGLSYNEMRHTLQWTNKNKKQRSLTAELIDTHPQGQLYQVNGGKQ